MRLPITLDELDQEGAEILPDRFVLSLINLSLINLKLGGINLGNSSSSAAATTGAGSACQTTSASGTPGLLGALGLGSSNPNATSTCIPAISRA